MKKISVSKFLGCGACKLVKEDCIKKRIPVKIIFEKSQKSGEWGNPTIIFKKGEIIDGKAMVKDDKVYCALAESNNIHHEEFVDLDNVKIEILD